MQQKKIKKIVKKRVSGIRQSALNIIADDDMESIHELRVNFKKFRAFIRLLRNKKAVRKYLRIPEKLKSLYKNAGALRDRQLYFDLVNRRYKKEMKPAFLDDLSTEITTRKKIIQRYAGSFSFKRFKNLVETHLPKKIDTKSMRKYFSDQRESCTEMLREPDSDEKFHAIRKRIQDILNNARILKDKKFMDSFNQKEEKLKSIEDSIGDYNDTRTAISFLNDEINNHENTGHLQIIIKKCYAKKRKLKKRILEELSEFPWE